MRVLDRHFPTSCGLGDRDLLRLYGLGGIDSGNYTSLVCHELLNFGDSPIPIIYEGRQNNPLLVRDFIQNAPDGSVMVVALGNSSTGPVDPKNVYNPVLEGVRERVLEVIGLFPLWIDGVLYVRGDCTAKRVYDLNGVLGHMHIREQLIQSVIDRISFIHYDSNDLAAERVANSEIENFAVPCSPQAAEKHGLVPFLDGKSFAKEGNQTVFGVLSKGKKSVNIVHPSFGQVGVFNFRCDDDCLAEDFMRYLESNNVGSIVPQLDRDDGSTDFIYSFAITERKSLEELSAKFNAPRGGKLTRPGELMTRGIFEVAEEFKVRLEQVL